MIAGDSYPKRWHDVQKANVWKGSGRQLGVRPSQAKGGNHTPEGNDRLERCEEEEKAALARVGEEVPKPGDNPVDRPLEPQDKAKILVARLEDHATDAAREARLEAADAQMTETREVGEHKLVEMDVEVADVESRALKRSKVPALTIDGRLVILLMQSVVVAMMVSGALPSR